MTIEIYDYSNSTWFDLTPFIKFQGVSFSLNSIDSPDAGRDMSGLMHRGMVAIKEKMNVNTVALTREQSAKIYSLLMPETILVRVNPYPRTNAVQTMNMYSNNVKTTYLIHRDNGEDIQELSFPLIEN